MNNKIVNRVANSGLITIDLSDYAPKKPIENLDLKKFLFESLILKEKDFRFCLKQFDFSFYTNKIVAVNCSANSILPMWAFMLVSSQLNEVNADVYFGSKEEVFEQVFIKNIDGISEYKFENKKVIVKGCGGIKLTAGLYIAITNKLQNVVHSLMFGEACSSVPVFKRSRAK